MQTSKGVLKIARKKKTRGAQERSTEGVQDSARAVYASAAELKPFDTLQARTAIGAPPALSKAQDQVANAPPDKRILVEAGPGTGKTEVVAHRLVRLIEHGLKPAQILVLSFSRSAVGTLTHRLEGIRDQPAGHLEELRYLTVRTFDSWTFRMLRKLNFTPAQLLARSYNENIDTLIQQIGGAKRAEALDLLMSIRHIIVDEFQDLSGVRAGLVIKLLESLAPPGKSGAGFTVLGDPAQAIYGFALRDEKNSEYAALTSGALIQQLKQVYGHDVAIIGLEENFRATGQLASVMAHLRRLLFRRATGKTKFESMVKFSGKVAEIDGELKPAVLLRKDIRSAAVLTATNGEAIRVAQRLIDDSDTSRRLPVRLHSGSQPVVVPAWVAATLGQMRDTVVTRSQFQKIHTHLYSGSHQSRAVALGVPPVDVAWGRLATATGVTPDSGSVDLKVLRERIGWTDLFPDDDVEQHAGLHVMTIHQSKGMEFDAVAILADGLGQREYETDGEHAEAANVIFVGMTRAAKELFRVGEGKIYTPLWKRRFRSGRDRWYAWKRGWVNLELGIPGDIEPDGFVDRQVFGEDARIGEKERVRETQEMLAMECATLRGQKVMLCKWAVPDEANRYVYRIHLQDGQGPGRVLGVMTSNVTLDLLDLLYAKGFGLPSKIFNLRVSDVVTIGLQHEAAASLAEPWSKSGLWLGVNVNGTGDFKPFKRRT